MKILILTFLLIFSSTGHPDQFHYDSQNIGERAAGLGGAYTALSDDPSGIFHNPAGIVYNYENYFSLVSYHYSISKTVYKNALGSHDYTISTNNPDSNFFGFTQNFRKYKWGFAIVAPEIINADQNDSFDNLYPAPTTSNTESAKKFNRRLLDQYRELLVGVAGAGEISKDFTFGVSVFSGSLTRKTINTQYVEFNTNTSGQRKTFFSDEFLDQLTYFIYPKVGIQFMPIPNWSFGFVLAKKFTTYTNRSKKSIQTATDANGTPVSNSNDASKDVVESYLSAKPNMLSPLELSGGASYFPDKTLLYSADLKFYSNDPEFGSFTTQSILNLSLGVEYYLSEQTAIRGGLFTNNANTTSLSSTKTNQPDHLDYLGSSFTFSYLTPGSSVTLGCQYSSGKGKGQVVGGSTIQQEIDSSILTFLLNASMQL